MTTKEPPALDIPTRHEPLLPLKAEPKPMTELIRRHVTEDGVCVLTFDRPESQANIFDRAALLQLGEHLDWLERQDGLKGVVLASAKKSIFIAGADLHSIAKAERPEDIADLIELGQRVFNRLAALRVPTVAAIHGACVGGGCEIVLACDHRLASAEKATKIGLPEIQLGILPAWGGCTRLPRLIGLPRALDIILAGKTLAAVPALKCGLVDELVPREYLVSRACAKILAAGRALKSRKRPLAVSATASGWFARLISGRVEKELWRKTRGHYPAPFKALDVVTRGLAGSIDASLKLEREAILELGRTEVSRNLIRIFFLQERAKKITGAPGEAGLDKAGPVGRLAVIGAGVMGAGIAQWASSRDIQCVLRDVNPEQVGKGMAAIAKLYEQGVKRRALTKVEARAGLDRVTPAATEVPLKSTELVIEAAVEKMELKKLIFARLDELAGPNTILATNTSALSISEIAAATRHPERVIGIHFFNPVHKMQLVEVVVGRQTSPEVTRRAVKFTQQIGKLPVVVKDSPGFLVNRILMPYLVEAGHLFACGARVEDIDEAMLDFGMPMGPLRLIDEVGADVAHHVAVDLAKKFHDRMFVPAALPKMLEAGLLGKKAGKGFYVHPPKGEPDVNPAIDDLHHDASCAKLTRDELRTRLVLLMINEAARCLEEGVVAEPADVDFGMIMGTGFAPFTGGPLRFADFTGVAHLVDEMKDLAARGELRFTPCALLQTMAAGGGTFYKD